MDLLLGPTVPVDWESESYPLYEDFVVLPFFVLFFPTIRFILDRFVFEYLARCLIFGKGHAMLDVETPVKRKKLNKFKEAAWKCIYSLSAELLALYVTYGEPWFTDTRFFWVGPEDQIWPDQKMKLKLKGLYMSAAGFYIYSIFDLVFWEIRRSDFAVSMAHHVTTIILIVLSYIIRCTRVGSVVLALHEGSDVFLQVGKMSKYSGFERIASISFVFFVFSWLILRLIYYPFWILWSTSYEFLLILDKDRMIYYYLFNTLLFGLLLCHIYWWRLMFRMLIEQIQARGQISDDVRSDSEGDDEHED
uniref:TLC domain-containing protein n=1 Tax=Davidia involucrata TaxID=16924 RepID=A0A5B7CCZ5_DAVIN